MKVLRNQRGGIAVIAAIVLGVLFLITSFVAMWAIQERSTYKSNYQELVTEEVSIAVKENTAELEADFTEREKSPFRRFSAGSTIGSLTFEYPRSWSVYVEEGSGGNTMDLYAHPGAVHGTSTSKPYALRVQVLNRSYDTVSDSYASQIDRGTLKAKAFRPALVDSELGLRLDGEVSGSYQGSMVLLQLRDKTIQIMTESDEYVSDFNTLLKSVKYAP